MAAFGVDVVNVRDISRLPGPRNTRPVEERYITLRLAVKRGEAKADGECWMHGMIPDSRWSPE